MSDDRRASVRMVANTKIRRAHFDGDIELVVTDGCEVESCVFTNGASVLTEGDCNKAQSPRISHCCFYSGDMPIEMEQP